MKNCPFFHRCPYRSGGESGLEFNMHERGIKPLYRIVNWIVDIIAVIFLASFTVYSFGGRITVSGSSMNPTLESGDVVLINKLSYDIGKPKRYDIAAFEWEGSGTNIKRIIGLPGETIQIIDDTIYIDGEPLDSPEDLATASISGMAEYPIELAEDEYFLIGDNRDSSEDSRFSTVGNVKRDKLVGKVWLRILPLPDFGRVK